MDFLHYLESNGYLSNKLNVWTSLPKLSQYSEHSINYLERMFGKLTNKKKARRVRLPFLFEKLDDLINDILIRCEDAGVFKEKKQISNERFKSGK
jgi:hypothetical protein